jgi:hypothetical protein
METILQLGVFLLLLLVMAMGIYYLSLLWYRCCSDERIAHVKRLSPIGLIGCPLFFLAFALLTEPRSLFPIIAPLAGLLMCFASYRGLLRAAAERLAD